MATTDPYYSAKIESTRAPICVRTIDEVKGKGVFCVGIEAATTAFKEGDVVFSEKPLFCIQSPKTKHIAACDYCLKTISLSPMEAVGAFADTSNLPEIFPFLDRCYPMEQRLAAATKCPHCQAVQYCSEACRSAAYQQYHAAICDAHKKNLITKLEATCRGFGNHNGLLVCRMIATTIQSFLRSADSNNNNNNNNDNEALLQAALEPINKFINHYNTATTTTTSSSAAEKSIADMQNEEMLNQIKEIFGNYANDPRFSPLFTSEMYARMVSILNVNQQKVTPKSPFDIYWDNLSTLPPKEQDSAFDALDPLFEQLNALQLVTIPCVEGSAVYALQSCFNHSCDPNVGMRFLSDDNSVHVYVKKAIQPGDELCFDYVGFPPLADVHYRRLVLKKKYFFHCECARCMREEKQMPSPANAF